VKALALLVALVAGCGSVKIEGECTVKRTVETSYQCQPGGKTEAIRVLRPDLE
jgi:hypothetical protein